MINQMKPTLLAVLLLLLFSCQKGWQGGESADISTPLSEDMVQMLQSQLPVSVKLDKVREMEEAKQLSRWIADSIRMELYMDDDVFMIDEAVELAANMLVYLPTIDNSKERKLQQVYKLARLELTRGKLPDAMNYGLKGVYLADSIGDTLMYHGFNTIQAASRYRMNQKELSLPQMLKSVEYLEEHKGLKRDVFLSFAYGQLLTMLSSDDKQSAIAYGLKREELLDRMREEGRADSMKSGLLDRDYAFHCAKMADEYACVGQLDKAKQYEQLYYSTKFSNTLRGKQAILDYYMTTKNYPAFLQRYEESKDYWDHKDTLSNRYKTLMLMACHACNNTGRYAEARDYLNRYNILKKKLLSIEAEREDNLREMYMHKVSEQLAQVAKTNRLANIVLVLLLLTIGIILGAVLYLVIRHLYLKRENMTLQNEVVENKMKYFELVAKNQKKDDAMNSKILEKVEEFNRLFDEEQIFLQQDLSRTQLEERLGINKNLFSLVIKKAIGERHNLRDFISSKRVMYSCQLMEQHPEYTINDISMKSGFYTLRNYRTVFKQFMGVAPLEYKIETTGRQAVGETETAEEDIAEEENTAEE